MKSMCQEVSPLLCLEMGDTLVLACSTPNCNTCGPLMEHFVVVLP